MPKPIHDLHLDFETYCDLDLKKVGLYRYVEHPSFRVLCVAWKLDEQQTKWALGPNHGMAWIPEVLIQMLESPDVQGHAFNAAFETAVLKRLRVFIANPLSCTMQRALAYGLPGKLEAAAAALGVAAQKDMTGHRLMLKMSRPAKDGTAPVWSAVDHQALGLYCCRDVDAEAAVSAVIPQLQPEEAELSALDAAMNTGGELGIDMNRVCTLQVVAGDAERADAKRCAVLTAGAVTSPGTQTARLLSWVASKGIVMADTTRATIEEALANIMPEIQPHPLSDVEEVLRIRLRMARASTRKLERMVAMSEATTRALEGQFQFCGAGRTGRWSGRGVQVQNLPRIPKGFSSERFYEMALACVIRNDGVAFDAITPAPALDCVSWSLRSCLKAADDTKVLWSFDFSQIEAGILAWPGGRAARCA